jgi:hypothetical protein
MLAFAWDIRSVPREPDRKAFEKDRIKEPGEDLSMSSSSCGKACLVGCIIVVVLSILAGIGCFVCVANSPLGAGLKNTVKIQTYFTNLESQGWEVDDSESNQPSGYGVNVETGQLMIWKARENPDDEWTYYVWEFGPVNPNALNEGDIWAMFDLQLLPRTEAALDVHRELNLPLPDGFELREWHSPDEDRNIKDRNRGDHGEETSDDEGGGGEENGESGRKPGKPGRPDA